MSASARPAGDPDVVLAPGSFGAHEVTDALGSPFERAAAAGAKVVHRPGTGPAARAGSR